MDTTRHNDLLGNIPLHKKVHIIGCGSIGTVVAQTMARVGFDDYVIYDDDVVEEHNIANQYFEYADMKKKKVDALKEKILRIHPEAKVLTIDKRWEPDFTEGVIIFNCVDNMASRINIFNKLKGNENVYIEARMGLHEAQVHSLHTDNLESVLSYEKTLYDDAKAEELPCTAKSVIYTVQVTASIMVRQLMKKLQEQQSEEGISDHEVRLVDMQQAVIL